MPVSQGQALEAVVRESTFFLGRRDSNRFIHQVVPRVCSYPVVQFFNSLSCSHINFSIPSPVVTIAHPAMGTVFSARFYYFARFPAENVMPLKSPSPQYKNVQSYPAQS